ncbi:hypothetical protein [Chryseobacterium sp. LAM-KRS1]|uniref:hypothetical protein n=1 Tax=Chryseobacterium sp. LAM-KRS1 TaxID=2715754 RepID=UPI001556F75D|nr:hypothetical protein [Chryseobacterium sp. LAM-KRS1]
MAEDYKAFNIYKPANGFVWTRERLIYILIGIPFLTVAFVLYILKVPEKEIPGWFAWIIGIPMFIAFIGGFINVWFPEQLKGRMEGKLIFEKEKITVDNEVFLTQNLKYVEIVQNDHKGRFIIRNGADGAFSQGCNNYLKIRLLDNEERKVLFQIKQPGELLQISNQLNFYIEQGLMTKEARNNILNYTS